MLTVAIVLWPIVLVGVDVQAQCTFTELVSPAVEEAASFGSDAAFVGDLALVGAPWQFCGSRQPCGAVFSYAFDEGIWTLHDILTPPDSMGEESERFGAGLDANADRLIVGAQGRQCEGSLDRQCGAAYIYRRAGNEWVLEGRLDRPDAVSGDNFGFNVAVYGDVAIVGARFLPCGSRSAWCGAAFVYRFGDDGWHFEQTLTTPDVTAGASFGNAISIEGDVAVIGAPGVLCPSGDKCGAAYVFRRIGNTWVEEAKLQPSDLVGENGFGGGVDLDGDLLLIGADRQSCADGVFCGAAYVFRYGGGEWTQVSKVTPIDRRSRLHFGGGLIQSDKLFITTSAGVSGSDAAVYIFDSDEAGWSQSSRFRVPGMRFNDAFGTGMTVSGQWVLVGAAGFDVPEIDSGRAFIFELEPLDCDDPNLAGNCPGLEDCNGNDLPDKCDLIAGAPDCDLNEIPDGCQGDADGDSLIDECDVCPESTTSHTIVIGGCDTGVSNIIFDDGCTMVDVLAECDNGRRNHGDYITCVNETSREWKQDRLIAGREFADIVACAAESNTGRSTRPERAAGKLTTGGKN